MTVSDRRKHFMEAVGEHLPNSVYFHGTTPEAAEAISREGFRTDMERHGQSAGSGVYLHKDPLVAGAHGDTVVAVKLAKGTKIANPTDTADAEWRAIRNSSAGGSHEERMYQHLHDWDYHGHTDPDDRSVVVHDPQRVHYMRHYARPSGFGPDDWMKTYSDG